MEKKEEKGKTHTCAHANAHIYKVSPEQHSNVQIHLQHCSLHVCEHQHDAK